MIAVDLKGAFLCAKQAATRMIAQGQGGRMIFTASIAAYEGGGFHGPYGAAKGGLCTLVKTMAHEWAPYGITVNAVCPGLTRTGINEEISADPELEAQFLKKIPVGRMAEPVEIASLMLYLATDAAGDSSPAAALIGRRRGHHRRLTTSTGRKIPDYERKSLSPCVPAADRAAA